MIIEAFGVPGIGKSTAESLLVNCLLPNSTLPSSTSVFSKNEMITLYRQQWSPINLDTFPTLRKVFALPQYTQAELGWCRERMRYPVFQRILSPGVAHIGRRCTLEKRLLEFIFSRWKDKEVAYISSEGLLQACIAMRVWGGKTIEPYVKSLLLWWMRQQQHSRQVLLFTAKPSIAWKRLQNRGIPHTWPIWAMQTEGRRYAFEEFMKQSDLLSTELLNRGIAVEVITINGTLQQTKHALKQWVSKKYKRAVP